MSRSAKVLEALAYGKDHQNKTGEALRVLYDRQNEAMEAPVDARYPEVHGPCQGII